MIVFSKGGLDASGVYGAVGARAASESGREVSSASELGSEAMAAVAAAASARIELETAVSLFVGTVEVAKVVGGAEYALELELAYEVATPAATVLTDGAAAVAEGL